MSIKTKLNGLFYLLKPSTKLYLPIGVRKNIIIYDDFFPNPLTGFRLDEFTYLLNCIDSSKIIIDSEASSKSENLKEFLVKQGQGISKNRITFASRINNINAKIVYIVFYFNVLKIFKFLEVFHIRYIVTLYPGGGFVINDNTVDKNLKRILGHELCRAVIVNQRFTRQYLLKKKICSPDKIHLIFGLPIGDEKLNFDFLLKKKYPYQKPNIDVCFVGLKYTKEGKDKGYDVFLSSAKIIAQRYSHCRFHVIGGFSKHDIPVDNLQDKIIFYGNIAAEKLNNLLMGFDVMVAPNRADTLKVGAFDGFPVGCCVESLLVGCAVLTTDPKKENVWYKDGEEIIIIEPLKEIIVEKLEMLIEDPKKLDSIGYAGMKRTKILYSQKEQMRRRADIIKACLKK